MNRSRPFTDAELAAAIKRYREKFGPFQFGEPQFGDWPAEGGTSDGAGGGGGIMPTSVPAVRGWKSVARVHVRSRTRQFGGTAETLLAAQRALRLEVQNLKTLLLLLD